MPRLLNLELLEVRDVPTFILNNVGPDMPGVFRNGTWYLDTNGNHLIDSGDLPPFVYGLPTDTPIVGDWNADGHAKVGVFRNVNGVGQFILDFNGDHVYDAGDHVFTYGLGTDTPVAGDWDAAGRTKVGVFRNVNGVGQFILDTNGHETYDLTSTVFNYGAGTDRPVIGDWNADGTSKVGVFRTVGNNLGQFRLDLNNNHVMDALDLTANYGFGTDTPVIGDWNGDTRSKVGIVRNITPTFGTGSDLWVLDYNNNLVYDSADQVYNFGLNNDRPVVGRW